MVKKKISEGELRKRSYSKLKGFKYTEETDHFLEEIIASLVNRVRLYKAKKLAKSKSIANNNKHYHVVEYRPRVNVTYAETNKREGKTSLTQRSEELNKSVLLVICNTDRKDLMRDGYLSKKDGAYYEIAKRAIYSTHKG